MIKKIEKIFREFFPKHLKNKNRYINAIKNREGIEIGGPSFTFGPKGLLPIYTSIKNLDGCNYSDNTVWEGKLQSGKTYLYSDKKAKGTQFICEGSDLSMVKDNTYDFVLSCHNLEHYANPLKALHEWKRIVKDTGCMIIVLPNRLKTFDHNRKPTSIEHIKEDYRFGTDDHDETHFEEVIADHDLMMDEGVSSREELRERVQNNFVNRCVHHHVFDEHLAKQVLMEAGLEIVAVDLLQIHIFLLAKVHK